MSFNRDDIRPCHCCQRPLGAGGVHFYRVHIEQLIMDTAAISREAGLEAMMGGNVAIARAMSPERDFAQVVGENTLLICGECAASPQYPMLFMETGT